MKMASKLFGSNDCIQIKEKSTTISRSIDDKYGIFSTLKSFLFCFHKFTALQIDIEKKFTLPLFVEFVLQNFVGTRFGKIFNFIRNSGLVSQ